MYVLAALDLNDVATDTNHGQMTAVVRYETPYIVTGKGPFVLSFTLGNDVSLRSILGLPTLLTIGAGIDLIQGLLSCVKVIVTFLLLFRYRGRVTRGCYFKSLLTHCFPYRFY